MIRVGINGFGRIGRAITKIISKSKNIKISVINEIDENIGNLYYLLKYDSIYGKLDAVQLSRPTLACHTILRYFAA